MWRRWTNNESAAQDRKFKQMTRSAAPLGEEMRQTLFRPLQVVRGDEDWRGWLIPKLSRRRANPLEFSFCFCVKFLPVFIKCVCVETHVYRMDYRLRWSQSVWTDEEFFGSYVVDHVSANRFRTWDTCKVLFVSKEKNFWWTFSRRPVEACGWAGRSGAARHEADATEMNSATKQCNTAQILWLLRGFIERG